MSPTVTPSRLPPSLPECDIIIERPHKPLLPSRKYHRTRASLKTPRGPCPGNTLAEPRKRNRSVKRRFLSSSFYLAYCMPRVRDYTTVVQNVTAGVAGRTPTL